MKYLDRYEQPLMHPEVCPVCGDVRSDVVEIRDTRTHRVIYRTCQDCERRRTT